MIKWPFFVVNRCYKIDEFISNNSDLGILFYFFTNTNIFSNMSVVFFGGHIHGTTHYFGKKDYAWP